MGSLAGFASSLGNLHSRFLQPFGVVPIVPLTSHSQLYSFLSWAHCLSDLLDLFVKSGQKLFWPCNSCILHSPETSTRNSFPSPCTGTWCSGAVFSKQSLCNFKAEKGGVLLLVMSSHHFFYFFLNNQDLFCSLQAIVLLELYFWPNWRFKLFCWAVCSWFST